MRLRFKQYVYVESLFFPFFKQLATQIRSTRFSSISTFHQEPEAPGLVLSRSLVRPDPTIWASRRSLCTAKLERAGYRRFRPSRLLVQTRVSRLSACSIENYNVGKNVDTSRVWLLAIYETRNFSIVVSIVQSYGPWQNFMLRLKLSDIVRLFSYIRRSLYGQFGASVNFPISIVALSIFSTIPCTPFSELAHRRSKSVYTRTRTFTRIRK